VNAFQFNRTGESRYSLHDVALSLARCERHSRYPTLRGDFTHPNRKDTVEVHRVDSEDTPGGLGEVGTAIAAPALTNAIFAATGVRLRSLPVDRSLLVEDAGALRKVIT
jgi:hypothetical protein